MDREKVAAELLKVARELTAKNVEQEIGLVLRLNDVDQFSDEYEANVKKWVEEVRSFAYQEAREVFGRKNVRSVASEF